MLQQDYKLAEVVFQALLNDAASEEPRLKVRLTKAMPKEASPPDHLPELSTKNRDASMP